MPFATVDDVFQRLDTALRDAALPTPVGRGAPVDDATEPGVVASLLAVRDGRVENPASARRARLAFTYVLSATPVSAEGEQLIAEVAFAVDADEALHLAPREVPLDFWRAHGLMPRPAVVLGCEVERTRSATAAPPVETVVVEPRHGAVAAGHAASNEE